MWPLRDSAPSGQLRSSWTPRKATSGLGWRSSWPSPWGRGACDWRNCGPIRLWSSSRGEGWRERDTGTQGAAAEKEVEQGEALTYRQYGPWQGQIYGLLRGHAQGLGARLPHRGLPVRQERQMERRRTEGRRGPGQHRLVQTGRRMDVDRKGSGSLRRPRPRGVGGGQAPSRRRDLRHVAPRRVHVPHEVRLGGYERGRRGPREPSRIPARHHHGPRRPAGTGGALRSRKRGKQDQTPLRRGLQGPERYRVVETPSIVVAGTHSGVGKTTVASGLMAALSSEDFRVAPFKVGPDFIDPSYHTLAAGRPGRNLDAFLSGPDLIGPLFAHGAKGTDIAVIEGVMGLFDGKSGRGELASTAHVAKLLKAPVVLVVDARAMARSVAAMVHGYSA